ncbi:hypothetical protein ACH0B5_03540 [Ureibacillus sp. 179-F W5.1 NHS]|uniref:DUF2178 domain-containing protein n=1 Tax=Lysinibacillus halotolerans TaxID=1368476 RepID=A0A3M8H7R2_9BACI|nr:hypothetical protein [Lysinibacillus halotolerans]RNC98471.1 hypothetical protein EC501_10880 [Lysinibacillus halotolerans]
MRLPNWSLLLFNISMCAAFGFVAISSYSNGARLWWLWGLISILYAYITIHRLIKSKKEGLTSKEIVEDQRTVRMRLISCSIAFIYILIVLSVGIFSFYVGYLTIDPVIYMVFAIITSLLAFVIAQLIQVYLF